MLTDSPPRKANRSGFLESDRSRTLDLPHEGRLPAIAESIASAIKSDKSADVRRACAEFLAIASEFYEVPACGVRVLAARPLRVRERWTTELFGDYSPETMLIRVWMRTAVRKEVTSFGTFVSTLCHEFCHHLDFSEVRIPRLMAHSRILRASGCALPSCERNATEATVLGARDTGAMANRLAADKSRSRGLWRCHSELTSPPFC
jgi:hypothetical protein